MASTKEIVVVSAEKGVNHYQGAFQKANRNGEKKERIRRGMTIKKEKMVTLSKKEAEELLFTLKKDDRDEYMKRIAELLQDEKAPEEKTDKE